MCMWIEEFAKTCGMGVGDEGDVYIYVCGQRNSLRPCGMGVGDEGGVYICVCGQKSSLRLVGWVQGMKEVYIYVYVDRRVR